MTYGIPHMQTARHKQQGAATLVMTLSILVLLTVMTLLSSEIYTTESRLAGNEVRERQAFEAAMTGFERAMSFIENAGKDLNDDGDPDYLLDGSDADSYIDAVVSGTTDINVTVGGNTVPVGHYFVEICDIDSDLPTCDPAYPDDSKLLIHAQGWSDDYSGQRHIVAVTDRTPALANGPKNPFISKGAVVINGNGTVTNSEGRSTIWSGYTVDFQSATYKTSVQSPTDPSQMVIGTTKDSPGADVVDNDANLSAASDDALFANFFGVSPSIYRDSYATIVTTPGDFGTNVPPGTEGEIIWVDGDLGALGNNTYGSIDHPVILIIDGSPTFTASPNIFGLVYIMGDMDQSAGSVNVTGAVVVEGVSDVQGTFNVNYNSTVISNLGKSGASTVTPGSWKDWL